MTEVPAAAGAGDLVALAVRIFANMNVTFGDRLEKARPAGAGFELRLRAEQIEPQPAQ